MAMIFVASLASLLSLFTRKVTHPWPIRKNVKKLLIREKIEAKKF